LIMELRPLVAGDYESRRWHHRSSVERLAFAHAEPSLCQKDSYRGVFPRGSHLDQGLADLTFHFGQPPIELISKVQS